MPVPSVPRSGDQGWGVIREWGHRFFSERTGVTVWGHEREKSHIRP
jgi:hypothetical protein